MENTFPCQHEPVNWSEIKINWLSDSQYNGLKPAVNANRGVTWYARFKKLENRMKLSNIFSSDVYAYEKVNWKQ